MGSSIIDRRLNGKNKSADNRKRFIERFKDQIKKQVKKIADGGSIKNIAKDKEIPITTDEPIIHHGKGGDIDRILPGNRTYKKNDKLRKPMGGSGGMGSQSGNSGTGEDEFMFELSREEFLDILFEDMELPNLVKKQLLDLSSFKWKRAGYTNSGVPSNINIPRSFKNSLARRISYKGAIQSKIEQLQTELKSYGDYNESRDETTYAEPRAQEIIDEITTLRNKIKNVPYFDDVDLKYNHRIKHPEPTSAAVMFCLMDVSGSMDEDRKYLAKNFYLLLYLFLEKKYEKLTVVFIRYHTKGKECDEHEFFYSRETGGTICSEGIQIVKDLMNTRFNANYNFYVAHATDGDNHHSDMPLFRDILVKDVLPRCQYYVYVETVPVPPSDLRPLFESLMKEHSNISMGVLYDPKDVYQTLRTIFEKKG